MSLLLIGCFSAVVAAVPATGPAIPTTLPADWPPLPDFRQRIDYIQWHLDQVADSTEDSHIWDELFGDSDDTPKAQAVRHRLWGHDDDMGVPGLFTGIDPVPDQYAWEPGEHPEWEQAWQTQRANGLHEKLIQASLTPQARFDLSSRRRATATRPAQPEDALDGRLLLTTVVPSLSTHRLVAKVLLQNAWRAPHGEFSIGELLNATEASYRLARNLDESDPSPLAMLVANEIRRLASDNVLHLLEENALDAHQIESLSRLLLQHDGKPMTCQGLERVEVAILADLLQFVYEPADGVWRQPSRLNSAHLQQLTALVASWNRDSFQGVPRPLPIVEGSDKVSATDAVDQLTRFQLQIRDALQAELPQTACSKIRALTEKFKIDPAKHVILRQFLYMNCDFYVIGIAQAEARRRATHLIVGIHEYRHRVGRWPESLNALSSALPEIIRIDPFSGRPFIYRLQDGEFLLYSVALNGNDDGGRNGSDWAWSIENVKPVDYVFWPIPRDGN